MAGGFLFFEEGERKLKKPTGAAHSAAQSPPDWSMASGVIGQLIEPSHLVLDDGNTTMIHQYHHH